MDKKNKNSGKFSTTTNYSHKQENSVQRRLKRPDQPFYSGGGNNGASNSSSGASTANVTSPTNNTFHESGGPHTRDSGFVIRVGRDKKPPLATITGTAMQLPHNCPSNIETMPPRFQRKWLQENNLPLDYFETQNANANPYASQSSSMAPPPSHNRSQTLPNKGHASRGGNRNNFYGTGGNNSGPNSSAGGGYGGNGKGNHGRPSPGFHSPMRSRSRSSDQRGSRHSSRNSSLERGGGTRIFSNSNNKQHQEIMYDNQRRHGTRSPDYNRGRGDNNKNYGNKNWTKQNYYGNKSMEHSDRRDFADLPPRGKDSVIFVSDKLRSLKDSSKRDFFNSRTGH